MPDLREAANDAVNFLHNVMNDNVDDFNALPKSRIEAAEALLAYQDGKLYHGVPAPTVTVQK